MFSCVLHVFSQLKSLFEIFTFVSERNIKYQYLIMASLILVTCYRNSVNRFSTIQLRLINKFNTDFESYFVSVSNFRLVCLLHIYFRFWPTFCCCCWNISCWTVNLHTINHYVLVLTTRCARLVPWITMCIDCFFHGIIGLRFHYT